MKLLSPIELARIVEADLLRQLGVRIAEEKLRFAGTVAHLAEAGVEVSSPGIAIDEQNVAHMPIGHLSRIAMSTLSDFDSAAPTLATRELGTTLFLLLRRGLPASTAGAVQQHLAPVMLL